VRRRSRAGIIANLSDKEPALTVAGLAGAVGFLGQAGVADREAFQALAVALGISGTQGLATRQRVYSPRGARRSRRKRKARPAVTPPPLTAAVNQAEPALLVALITGVLAFLVQVSAGEGLLSALAAAGGISTGQGLVTRPAVYSPGRIARDRWRRRLKRHGPRAPRSKFRGHPPRPAKGMSG
jgi:hypothetical protein